MDKTKKHRYKHSHGKPVIEVRVKSAQQLFDARDPAPFRERDLDDDFVEYVVSSAREFSLASPIKFLIHVEGNEAKELTSEAIREAIYEFFNYKIDLKRRELKSFVKQAQFFLLIGLLILAVCLTIAQNIVVTATPGVAGVIREGLVIFGWVSIWKPIELILFDWYPLYEKIRFYEKLAKTEIEIKFSNLSQNETLGSNF